MYQPVHGYNLKIKWAAHWNNRSDLLAPSNGDSESDFLFWYLEGWYDALKVQVGH